MKRKKSSLEDDLSAVFERACREQDFLVAEYLLQALEVFAQRDGNDLPLQNAYHKLLRSLSNAR